MKLFHLLSRIGVSIGTVCGVTCAALCAVFVFANPVRNSSRHAAVVTTTYEPLGPERTVAHLRDRNDGLGICQPHASAQARAAGARTQVKADHFGKRFLSVNTWIAFTWSASVIGLSTVTVSGTRWPFSTSGGTPS